MNLQISREKGTHLKKSISAAGYSALAFMSKILALQRDTLGFTRVRLPVCAAFCNGSGSRSRNSQLGNLVQNFRHFRNGVSVRLTNQSYWDSCLRWFMGVK